MISSFIGIDYGSKLAGTTAIARVSRNGKNIETSISARREDADKMILKYVEEENIKTVFVDAPLSLPSALVGKGDNYFYRDCDKVVNAMSPMFLGGLTARAMKLRDDLDKLGAKCYEVYPGGFIKTNEELKPSYKKKDRQSIGTFMEKLNEILPYKIDAMPATYHEVDAIISWYLGYKYHHGIHTTLGKKQEGQIII